MGFSEGQIVIESNYNNTDPYIIFSDTPQGAEASALVFSIIETATANGLDPYEYLVHIFRSLPNLDFYNKPDSLDSHMPWSGTLPEFCYAKKTNKEAEEGK